MTSGGNRKPAKSDRCTGAGEDDAFSCGQTLCPERSQRTQQRLAQYYPAGLVGKGGRDGYAEINRHLYREEYLQAVDLGHHLGLRLDVRSVASPVRLAPADAPS